MTEQKSCKGSHGENIEQVLITIIFADFWGYKIIAQAIAHRKTKIMHNLTVRKTFHTPQNLPNLPSKEGSFPKPNL